MNFIRNNSYLSLSHYALLTFIGINKMEKEVVYDKVIVAEGDTLWDSMQYANKSDRHMD